MKILRLFGFTLIVFCVAFMFGLTGCGGGGGDDNPPADDGGTTAIDVTGTWNGTFFTSGLQTYKFVLVQTGTSVTGTGTASNNATRTYTGTITGNHLVITSISITFDMTVSGNTMVGTFSDSTWNDKPANFTR